MKPHEAVGIAILVFYTPITLYAQYIGLRCWKYGPRMACYMTMVFTLSVYLIDLFRHADLPSTTRRWRLAHLRGA